MAKVIFIISLALAMVSCKKTEVAGKTCYTCQYRSSVTSSSGQFDICLSKQEYDAFNPNNSIFICIKK